jgi:hypothetical protein
MLRKGWLLPALLLTSSCGGKVIATDAKVQGKLDLGSFPSSVVAVQAANELNQTVDADRGNGSFTLVLPQGHSYRVTVVHETGSVPLVFPRNGGLLDLNFHVKTGGAALSLGTIHYWGSAPQGGLAANDDAAESCEGSDGDNVEYEDQGASDGECENGVCAGTAADEEADPSEPMAVGEYNVPNEVSGCAGEESDNED